MMPSSHKDIAAMCVEPQSSGGGTGSEVARGRWFIYEEGWGSGGGGGASHRTARKRYHVGGIYATL